MKLEPETQNLQTEAEHVQAMLGSEGWRIVERKLTDRLIDLQSVMNIEGDDPAKIMTDIIARREVVKLTTDWLKRDIYGFVDQQLNAKEQLHQEVNDITPHIERR